MVLLFDLDFGKLAKLVSCFSFLSFIIGNARNHMCVRMKKGGLWILFSACLFFVFCLVLFAFCLFLAVNRPCIQV